MVGFFLRRDLVRLAGCAGVAIALVGFPQLASVRADITYDILDFPASENGWKISGTITTDGTLGDLLPGNPQTNILSWQWTVTQPSGSATSLIDGDLKVLIHGNLDATGQSLSLDAGATFTLGDNTGSSGAQFLRWENTSGTGDMTIEAQLASETPQFWDIPTTTFQFATVSTPEPSTLVLFSGFGALSMLVGWRRRKQPARMAE